MADTLQLHPAVVVDDVVKSLQAHLHVPEPVCVLPLLAGVYIGGGDLHEGVEILGVGANEVQQAVSKTLWILREGGRGREKGE